MILGILWSAPMWWTKSLATWVAMVWGLEYIQSYIQYIQRNPTVLTIKCFCVRDNLCKEINGLLN